uniref:RNA-directed DNA polymerase n=1 Tax=Bos mutus grunniens TaxID=30521 RepID=A0A8B9Y6V7_BOSMU
MKESITVLPLLEPALPWDLSIRASHDTELQVRNLYAGQEARVRTGHGTTDWFQIGKGVHQGCILSPCLFNFYAEYIMRNAGLEEIQAGIKIAGRNINNLRYADDTTLMAESEEELKSLLMKVKVESEKLA